MQIGSTPRSNFLRLIDRIQPSEAELTKAAKHQESCKDCLKRAFDLKEFGVFGSHARNDAIKVHSDLDCLALLPRSEVFWGKGKISSDTFIRKVSKEMKRRYSGTSIKKDGQAIVLSFGTGQHSMDVVPAFFAEFDTASKKPVYSIPDGQKGWMKSSPAVHNAFITAANLRSKGKLQRTAQLIKYWKYSRANAIPISSFYISMFLAAQGVCVGARSYPELLHTFFKLMHQRGCRGFRDPKSISGIISPARTTPQMLNLKKAIKKALVHSENALDAERKGNAVEANRQWNIVFNGKF